MKYHQIIFQLIDINYEGTFEDLPFTIVDEDEEDENDYINQRSTEKIKRSVNSEIVYDALHNKMQNELARLLKRRTDIYKKVFVEKGRVDIKAKTNDNKWHYFEIKTFGSCKRSIRNAIGQVMEYALWPGIKRAEELIIVSENEANAETINYMKYLRENYNLPIYYQSFKLPKSLGKKV